MVIFKERAAKAEARKQEEGMASDKKGIYHMIAGERELYRMLIQASTDAIRQRDISTGIVDRIDKATLPAIPGMGPLDVIEFKKALEGRVKNIDNPENAFVKAEVGRVASVVSQVLEMPNSTVEGAVARYVDPLVYTMNTEHTPATPQINSTPTTEQKKVQKLLVKLGDELETATDFSNKFRSPDAAMRKQASANAAQIMSELMGNVIVNGVQGRRIDLLEDVDERRSLVQEASRFGLQLLEKQEDGKSKKELAKYAAKYEPGKTHAWERAEQFGSHEQVLNFEDYAKGDAKVTAALSSHKYNPATHAIEDAIPGGPNMMTQLEEAKHDGNGMEEKMAVAFYKVGAKAWYSQQTGIKFVSLPDIDNVETTEDVHLLNRKILVSLGVDMTKEQLKEAHFKDRHIRKLKMSDAQARVDSNYEYSNATWYEIEELFRKMQSPVAHRQTPPPPTMGHPMAHP